MENIKWLLHDLRILLYRTFAGSDLWRPLKQKPSRPVLCDTSCGAIRAKSTKRSKVSSSGLTGGCVRKADVTMRGSQKFPDLISFSNQYSLITYALGFFNISSLVPRKRFELSWSLMDCRLNHWKRNPEFSMESYRKIFTCHLKE